jgi:hypothetical protein
MQDSIGRDALMYCVMKNHSNTFDFIMDSVSVKKEESKEAPAQLRLTLDSVDT